MTEGYGTVSATCNICKRVFQLEEVCHTGSNLYIFPEHDYKGRFCFGSGKPYEFQDTKTYYATVSVGEQNESVNNDSNQTNSERLGDAATQNTISGSLEEGKTVFEQVMDECLAEHPLTDADRKAIARAEQAEALDEPETMIDAV